MKFIDNKFLRFILVGAFNTGFTYLLYIALLYFFSYFIAYSITYIIGIGVSYLINTIFVFNKSISLKKALQFPIVYAIQYVLGATLLYIFVGFLGIDKFYAPVAIIIICTPITYFLSGYILKERISNKNENLSSRIS
ncbi:MAG: GtrA family protein [Gammaproteobacteria bacterium]